MGVKILGDADEIEGVLDKLRDAAGGADGGRPRQRLDGRHRRGRPGRRLPQQLLEDGGLGDSDTFRTWSSTPTTRPAVLYVDFDAGDDWLAELAGDDDEVRDNLEPLDALGMSAWVDDDTAHAVLKVTTD